MNNFCRSFAKLTIVISAAAVLLLLGAAAILLFAPGLFREILRVGLAILCAAGGICVLVHLIRSLTESRRSVPQA